MQPTIHVIGFANPECSLPNFDFWASVKISRGCSRCRRPHHLESTMEALKFNLRDRNLELARVELPVITNPTQIIVKVAYAGICGTDLHILNGEFPCRENASITLGHEISGTVHEVGNAILTFKVGDKVAIDPNNGCKKCNFCHAGKPHFCKLGCINNTIGIYKDGGWAQYVICPEEQVHKIPANVTLEQAALAEPLSCLVHGWDIATPMAVGEKILITGAGIIGSLWVCALHVQGHRNVTLTEPNICRLELIRRLNTGYTLLTPDQLKKNQEADPCKYLFDVVIDCSGSPPAMEQAISLLNSGGKLIVFGMAPPKSKISISPFEIFMKEIKILGVNINPYTFQKALGLIEALGNRYLNFTNLGIKLYNLNQYQEALETLEKGAIAKAIFKM